MKNLPMNKTSLQNTAQGRMGFVDLGEPGPVGPTEILIATEYTGITNGTERGWMTCDRGAGSYPSRVGYQHVGKIRTVGERVTGYKVGDTVFYGQFVGHNGWNIVDVAAADPKAYWTHNCVVLPPGLDAKYCALLGVAGVGMRAARRFRVGPAQNVWVAGAGLVGQFAAQSARALGARVMVSDVQEKRLATAAGCGAERVLLATDDGFWAALKSEGPYDCIIDACGVDPLLFDIHQHGLIRHGSVVGLVACRPNTSFPWGMLHLTEASIEVSAHFSIDDLQVVLHFLRRGVMRIEPVVSHLIPFTEALAIYAALRDKPDSLLGVIIDWTKTAA